MLISAKNGILIVEFAKSSARRIADPGCRTRCAHPVRAVMMTSIAFIFGLIPLVWAHGAAMLSRRAVGTAVFAGMMRSSMVCS